MTLRDQGFRFVNRCGRFAWVHPAELLEGDVDCTDMSDAEFEKYVIEGGYA